MPNEFENKRNKQNLNDIDKLLAIPGVKEAVKMVKLYAFKSAREDAWVRNFIRRLFILSTTQYLSIPAKGGLNQPEKCPEFDSEASPGIS